MPDAALIQPALEQLQRLGWQLRWRLPGAALPDAVVQRYGRIPTDVAWFLEHVHSCAHPQDHAWLIGAASFLATDPEGFGWDAWERMCLDAADPEEGDHVRRFWDTHLPVAAAVHSGHDVFVVRTRGADAGMIFHGASPEFEALSPVASSLQAFLHALAQGISDRSLGFPLAVLAWTRGADAGGAVTATTIAWPS